MVNVNSNIRSPHGVDALKGDAPSLVVTTQAENSALKDASVDKESKTQRTEMQENQGGDLRLSDSSEPGEYRATAGPVSMQEKGIHQE
jgi:hypothetical protein